MATAQRTLHGSCSCGRNRYVIEVPIEQAQLAEICYDNTAASRNISASPISFWLRVPLTWYTSATFAQFPDESRRDIQRAYTLPFASNTRRQFCGYCGTPLTSWNERTADDAEHICVSLGSLLGEDQELLGQLGFLPGTDSEDVDTYTGPSKLRSIIRTEPQARGAPWFEELIENTRLGRIKQQRGGHSSRDGRVRVEWEVTEWTAGDDDSENAGDSSPSKRKFGDLDSDNTPMTNA